MLSDNISDVLEAYFAWARVNSPENIGYPRAIPTERLRGGSVGSSIISDDEAMEINECLGALKEYSEELWQVLIVKYEKRKSMRWLAQRSGISRITLDKRLAESEGIVRGARYAGGAKSG